MNDAADQPPDDSEPPARRFSAVVLAAGAGTRLSSARPKALHPVAGEPLLALALDALDALHPAPAPTTVVIRPTDDDVRDLLSARPPSPPAPPVDDAWSGEGGTPPGADRNGDRHTAASRANGPLWVIQSTPRGTVDALSCAADAIAARAPVVLVLPCDLPLVAPSTIAHLLYRHVTKRAVATCLVIREEGGAPDDRPSDAGDQAWTRQLGVYAFDDGWLWPALRAVAAAPEPGEPGAELSELFSRAWAGRDPVAVVVSDDPDEALDVNTRVDLARAERALRDRIRLRHLARGVTMIDPTSAWIDAGVTIGPDTVLWPDTYVLGRTVVGRGCTLGPGTVVRDSRIDDDVSIQCSVVESAVVGAGSSVGPFAHLRSGARLGSGVHVGNFGEVKNASLGRGVRMGHFGYLGDAEVGEDTNIGAGTVTCNFDGEVKHTTRIGRGAFIGSDTMLVAPVTVGDGARTGAGSVVRANVPPGATVVGVPARPIESVAGTDPSPPASAEGETADPGGHSQS